MLLMKHVTTDNIYDRVIPADTIWNNRKSVQLLGKCWICKELLNNSRWLIYIKWNAGGGVELQQ